MTESFVSFLSSVISRTGMTNSRSSFVAPILSSLKTDLTSPRPDLRLLRNDFWTPLLDEFVGERMGGEGCGEEEEERTLPRVRKPRVGVKTRCVEVRLRWPGVDLYSAKYSDRNVSSMMREKKDALLMVEASSTPKEVIDEMEGVME